MLGKVKTHASLRNAKKSLSVNFFMVTLFDQQMLLSLKQKGKLHEYYGAKVCESTWIFNYLFSIKGTSSSHFERDNFDLLFRDWQFSSDWLTVLKTLENDIKTFEG